MEKDTLEASLAAAEEFIKKVLHGNKNPSNEEQEIIDETIEKLVSNHPDKKREIKFRFEQFFKKHNITY